MCCIHPKAKINFETDKFYFYKLYYPLPEVQDIYIGITTDSEQLVKYINRLCIMSSMVPRQVKKVWAAMVETQLKHFHDWKVEIIGVSEFKNLEEAIEQQQKYVNKFGATLNALEQEDKQTHNRQRAKQHYAENKEKYHQKYLNYKESHREQIQERGTKKCLINPHIKKLDFIRTG